MRIFDIDGIELKSPNLEKGYLKSDSLFIMHHEAIEAVEEQGHWETIAEYPNGGKDVDWIVDVPAVEAKDAWDEYEPIQRFIAYTAKELAGFEIADLKAKLAETDYKILKIMEGAATMQEYADVIRQRAEWRKKINELEDVE